jgi:hypothetical protein
VKFTYYACYMPWQPSSYRIDYLELCLHVIKVTVARTPTEAAVERATKAAAAGVNPAPGPVSDEEGEEEAEDTATTYTHTCRVCDSPAARQEWRVVTL